ncbi:MAG TPA: hypothetical protein RMH85_19845 [Polyangiaceae bacterium LLY-WYZ-15_(1-7)]|nr:hypothetical protein [Myxococcales bacterium]MAT26151.1 hypothetical protein [Sandaracinus sp.]HJK94871.1 hypothetical protein [Polyangiaceae bacterium LLY-WYZ-15_(1-7)]MBJ73455.1 hypothetical protein [Sandaracinus sp.]HJL00509.1 hypothetical protein [Polyangiaceae bacterium LLY-WYZ-15_(1-7)]
MTAVDIRTDLEGTLDHVASAFGKLVANAGRGRPLSFPDLHKTTEGLFLSGWTYWEQFLRRLLIHEVSVDPHGVLRKEVKATGFRLKQSHMRLAQLITEHPDEGKWVEWSSIDAVKQRADALLGPNHRFANLAGNPLGDVRRLKKIRNAVAHKSDQAWQDFRTLVQRQPYGLSTRSMRGLTTGRFLSAHRVAGTTIFEHSIAVLRAAAFTIVP